MKKNIAILCLNKTFGKKSGKKLADCLDMFFVDINDLLEYNLINDDMLDSAGVDYFDKNQKKLVKEISTYENSCIFCSFDIYNKDENFVNIKQNSIIIYIKLTFEQLKDLSFKDTAYSGSKIKSELPFATENLICEKISDISIDATLNIEKNLKIIKKKLIEYCKI